MRLRRPPSPTARPTPEPTPVTTVYVLDTRSGTRASCCTFDRVTATLGQSWRSGRRPASAWRTRARTAANAGRADPLVIGGTRAEPTRDSRRCRRCRRGGSAATVLTFELQSGVACRWPAPRSRSARARSTSHACHSRRTPASWLRSSPLRSTLTRHGHGREPQGRRQAAASSAGTSRTGARSSSSSLPTLTLTYDVTYRRSTSLAGSPFTGRQRRPPAARTARTVAARRDGHSQSVELRRRAQDEEGPVHAVRDPERADRHASRCSSSTAATRKTITFTIGG